MASGKAPHAAVFPQYFILDTVDRANARGLAFIAALVVMPLRTGWPGAVLLAVLLAGIGVVAIVVDLFCSGFIDAFYLSFASTGAIIGVIMGWAVRWQTFVNLMRQIFDPRVDWANHLFRFILFAAFFGFIAYASFMAVSYSLQTGSWHRFLNPAWSGQPYIACFLWGWLASYIAGPRQMTPNLYPQKIPA